MEQIQRDEYKRHYSNMRFAQMTLYLTAMGGIIIMLWSGDSVIAGPPRIFVKLLAILLSIVFLVMEVRSTQYWKYFNNTTNSDPNGIPPYAMTDFWPHLKPSSTNMVLVLYYVMLISFTISLVRQLYNYA